VLTVGFRDSANARRVQPANVRALAYRVITRNGEFCAGLSQDWHNTGAHSAPGFPINGFIAVLRAGLPLKRVRSVEAGAFGWQVGKAAHNQSHHSHAKACWDAATRRPCAQR
jgi:hypothetical protein